MKANNNVKCPTCRQESVAAHQVITTPLPTSDSLYVLAETRSGMGIKLVCNECDPSRRMAYSYSDWNAHMLQQHPDNKYVKEVTKIADAAQQQPSQAQQLRDSRLQFQRAVQEEKNRLAQVEVEVDEEMYDPVLTAEENDREEYEDSLEQLIASAKLLNNSRLDKMLDDMHQFLDFEFHSSPIRQVIGKVDKFWAEFTAIRDGLVLQKRKRGRPANNVNAAKRQKTVVQVPQFPVVHVQVPQVPAVPVQLPVVPQAPAVQHQRQRVRAPVDQVVVQL